MIKKCLFLIFVSLELISCFKLCVPNQYQFNGGTSTIYPDEDSIRIGDTLWFNCSIPLNLKYNTGIGSDSANYNISGASNFGTDFHLTSPTGVNMQVGAMDSFTFVSITGGLKINKLDPHASKTISFTEIGNNYVASFGIIAQKKGIYALIMLDVNDGMKKCDKFSVTTFMNNADNHLHYLKDLYYGGAPIDALTATHCYCFKVY